MAIEAEYCATLVVRNAVTKLDAQHDHAAMSALALLASLEGATAWTISPDFVL